MDYREEVIRRTIRLSTERWREVYNEVKEILEHHYDFDLVNEKRYEHYQDVGEIVSEIFCHKQMDSLTEIRIRIKIFVTGLAEKTPEVRIETKGVLNTNYPSDSAFQKSLLYVVFRGVWDKLFYGWTREKWKKRVEEIVIEINEHLRGEVS